MGIASFLQRVKFIALHEWALHRHPEVTEQSSESSAEAALSLVKVPSIIQLCSGHASSHPHCAKQTLSYWFKNHEKAHFFEVGRKQISKLLNSVTSLSDITRWLKGLISKKSPGSKHSRIGHCFCHASLTTYIEMSPKPCTLIFSFYNFVKNLRPHLKVFSLRISFWFKCGCWCLIFFFHLIAQPWLIVVIKLFSLTSCSSISLWAKWAEQFLSIIAMWCNQRSVWSDNKTFVCVSVEKEHLYLPGFL